MYVEWCVCDMVLCMWYGVVWYAGVWCGVVCVVIWWSVGVCGDKMGCMA